MASRSRRSSPDWSASDNYSTTRKNSSAYPPSPPAKPLQSQTQILQKNITNRSAQRERGKQRKKLFRERERNAHPPRSASPQARPRPSAGSRRLRRSARSPTSQARCTIPWNSRLPPASASLRHRHYRPEIAQIHHSKSPKLSVSPKDFSQKKKKKIEALNFILLYLFLFLTPFDASVTEVYLPTTMISCCCCCCCYRREIHSSSLKPSSSTSLVFVFLFFSSTKCNVCVRVRERERERWGGVEGALLYYFYIFM
jgi:hypothetical protein